jgi:hypothetical protein
MLLRYPQVAPSFKRGLPPAPAAALVSIVLVCLAAGCGGTPSPSWYVEDTVACPNPGLSDPDPDAYAGYFYAMSYDQRKAFSKAVASLRFGESMQHVLDVLGEPDWAGPGQETVFSPVHKRVEITYAVAMYREDANDRNQLVSLSFNYYGGLDDIFSGYPGVASRRSVSAFSAGIAPDWLCPRYAIPKSGPRWLRGAPLRKPTTATDGR